MAAGVFGVRLPVLESMVDIETVFACRFTTYANLLDGSTATEVGLFPAMTVGGVFGVKNSGDGIDCVLRHCDEDGAHPKLSSLCRRDADYLLRSHALERETASFQRSRRD